MNKKIPFIILGVVIVGIIGLGFILSTTPEEFPKEEEGKEEEVILTQEEIMRKAIDTQDASLCEKLEKEEDKKYCRVAVINALAGIKEDPDICNQIEDEDTRAVCKDNVTITQAMNARDSSLCEKLIDKTRIEQCKKDVASLK